MPWSPRHVPSQCPCEVRLHRLVFLVRTTYIDLRHAGAHMMIRYARWVSSKSLKRILRGWLADPAGQASRKRVRG